MTKRSYETGSIRVLWDSDRCIHTGICLRSLPDVFDTSKRPWVTVGGAAADEIAETIEQCPSGALSYERLDGGPQERPADPVEIVPRPNGPLSIRGSMVIKDYRGEVFTETTRATLCRCGHSQNQPFCDLSHKSSGFRDKPSVITSERDRAVSPAEIAPSQDRTDEDR
ncbi:MAG: hypothetical protein HKO03_05615 [Acidimicrobiia bacterium]|nr:hypothetical protein [Acidimicrobiia bacterium]